MNNVTVTAIRCFIQLLFFVSIFSLSASKADSAELNVSEIDIALGMENYDFQPFFNQFTAETGIKVNILAFNNNQLKSELVLYAETAQLPDAVIVPSDYLGLTELDYSSVPQRWYKPDISNHILQSAQVKGVPKGIPIMYGNHLVLYYNSTLIERPFTDLQLFLQLPHKQPVLGWNYYEMYWFASLVNAQQNALINNAQPQLDTRAMRLAISNYQTLYNSGAIDPNCAYQCLMAKFSNAELPYFVNGIWAYQHLKHKLQDDLAISPLPLWGTQRLTSFASSHVLAFPSQALSTETRSALKLLAEFMQSDKVQDALWQELGTLPVRETSLALLLDSSDPHLLALISALTYTTPLPNDPIMAYVWEAMLKGVTRYLAGVYGVEKTTKYMQFIINKSIKND
ncbi:sugar ABC transporter substrate-binding protein [Pseudoalteromonas 'SMAR']|uniref:sugar ABC transporter substrate-binding protein n=1 Tax=Pseudoalteromonas 'SMAR' TaxID=3416908 RepID=UPI003AF26E39